MATAALALGLVPASVSPLPEALRFDPGTGSVVLAPAIGSMPR